MKIWIPICVSLFLCHSARASVAYGSINNFDTVNDTERECHGFEIEIEDCHSTDLTYTYNYNHYGVPKITEDTSVAGHPKCIVRWESKKNADGSWAAYTAIPAGPINPTNGHMFTNPNVNFGGEHFGVGYRVAVGAISYQWLVDNGSGQLVHGGAVQVATPQFTYNGGAVQAVINPPEPPEVHPLEFGEAVWVKEIRTTSHNNHKVKLRDLVSDDPDDDHDKNWKNGEPDEVEVEWQILQEEFGSDDGGGNGKLEGAPEDLEDGDEVVTRRYEFYEYVGPVDEENGEAKAGKVGPDGIHGRGIKTINDVEVDLSTVVIVGDYKGAQMAAVDVEAAVGLIEHVGEGCVDEPYVARRIIVEGSQPFVSERLGALPAGMDFDEVTGILSGTPTQSGEFQFKVMATDNVNPEVSQNYTLVIAAPGVELPPSSLVDTAASPLAAGSTSGDGAFAPGTEVTVTAIPAAGFQFANWTDNGKIVGTNASYTFTIDVNHSLIANFVPEVPLSTISLLPAQQPGGEFFIKWPVNPPGWILEESPDMSPESWIQSLRPVTTDAENHKVTVDPHGASKFYFRLSLPIVP